MTPPADRRVACFQGWNGHCMSPEEPPLRANHISMNVYRYASLYRSSPICQYHKPDSRPAPARTGGERTQTISRLLRARSPPKRGARWICNAPGPFHNEVGSSPGAIGFGE